jgi:hypothetical protein
MLVFSMLKTRESIANINIVATVDYKIIIICNTLI